MPRFIQPESTEGVESPKGRILAAAQRFLFAQGVNGLTMECLAEDLGVSKKTLYVHFPGKEAILGAIVDGVAAVLQRKLQTVVEDPSLNSTQKLCRLIETVGESMSRLSPGALKDLQVNAPAVFAKIDAIRRHNIPRFFGRILRDGMAEGSIRKDIDPAFACEFWMQAMRGMMHPETMERTQLTPRQTLENAVNLFFRGLMTPLGRDQYVEHCHLCKKHSTRSAAAKT